MKILQIVIFSIIFTSQIIYAEDVVQVNITGSINATTCNIKTQNQTVNLGAWQTQSISGIGSGINSQSDAVGYTLDLDCPAGLRINAQLEGNQYDTSNIYYIGLDKGDNAAAGVVIETHFYGQGKWQSLVYNSTRTLIANTIDGINSVSLRSYYRQVSSTIKSGDANATVTVTITYQ